MAKVAVLGYGTVGSGVVEVLESEEPRLRSKEKSFLSSAQWEEIPWAARKTQHCPLSLRRVQLWTDADVLMLAGADTADTHAVRLDFLQVTTGKGVKSVASIGLDISGQKFEAAASGNGPVDAAIKALKKIIMKQMTLKEFTIQAISKGSDDVGKVHMQVEYDGSLYYGFGANTDIVTASVEAYIDCINKFKKED